MWVCSMSLTYVSCILWGHEQIKVVRLLIIYVSYHLDIWMELYSWHYSKLTLCTENTIRNNIIIENIDTIHDIFFSIHTSIIRYLYWRHFSRVIR